MKFGSLLYCLVLLPIAACQQHEGLDETDKQIETASQEKGNDHTDAADQSDLVGLVPKAQELVGDGKLDEGYEAAKSAMKGFTEANVPLPRFRLESFTVGDRRVDVQLNMGPGERSMPQSGIVRPLSFHVFSADEDLLDVIDFEIGRFGGKSATAAIGKMEGGTHSNFGVIPVDSTYTAIRKAALRVINPDGLPIKSIPIKKEPALKLKPFLNIVAPKTSLLAPRVITTEKGIVVIGLNSRFQRRDVAAYRQTAEGWLPCGEGGEAITGVGGNFLSGCIRGRDGRIWVLTTYTRPSNPQRADRWFLYCLEDGRWVQKGPSQGHLLRRASGGALLIFRDRLPAHHYAIYNREKKHDEHRLAYLSDGEWIPAPAARLLTRDASVVTSASSIHLLRQDDPTGRYSLHEIDSPTMTDLPNAIDTFESEHRFGHFVMSQTGELAAQVWVGEMPRLFVRRRVEGKLSNQTIDLPEDESADDIGWSPSGKLFIVTTDLEIVRAFRLEGDQWKLAGQAKESSATVFDLKLFFGRDEQPIATWEEFYPH